MVKARCKGKFQISDHLPISWWCSDNNHKECGDPGLIPGLRKTRINNVHDVVRALTGIKEIRTGYRQWAVGFRSLKGVDVSKFTPLPLVRL